MIKNKKLSEDEMITTEDLKMIEDRKKNFKETISEKENDEIYDEVSQSIFNLVSDMVNTSVKHNVNIDYIAYLVGSLTKKVLSEDTDMTLLVIEKERKVFDKQVDEDINKLNNINEDDLNDINKKIEEAGN